MCGYKIMVTWSQNHWLNTISVSHAVTAAHMIQSFVWSWDRSTGSVSEATVTALVHTCSAHNKEQCMSTRVIMSTPESTSCGQKGRLLKQLAGIGNDYSFNRHYIIANVLLNVMCAVLLTGWILADYSVCNYCQQTTDKSDSGPQTLVGTSLDLELLSITTPSVIKVSLNLSIALTTVSPYWDTVVEGHHMHPQCHLVDQSSPRRTSMKHR